MFPSARISSYVSVYSSVIMELLKMSERTDSWNDDRLDEMSRRMDNGFEAVDRRFELVMAEIRHLHTRFDRLYYLVLVTIIGCFGSLIANGAVS
jgi:hypothetical protein